MKDFQEKKWYHQTTRIMGLLDIYLATEIYMNFQFSKKFILDTVVLGKNGKLERYVDFDQLEKFKSLVKKSDFSNLLKNFIDEEKPIYSFFKKNPIKNREEFLKIFRMLWKHEITSFNIGLFSEDKKTLGYASILRGSKNAQHVAISDFIPKLYKLISKKKKIPKEIIQYMIPNELLNLNFTKKMLMERKKGYVLIGINGKINLLVGKKAKEFEKDFRSCLNKIEIKDYNRVAGSTAYPGKVFGKVKLVLKESDQEKVNKNDILISPMTRTSFIKTMKKSAAFVTDEGGVTCHAAIIARELKKPCVVGTKFATQIFKDNDLVEVDANKGIVRKLK
jgi:phosphohistidine swiveling domain-containing protein